MLSERQFAEDALFTLVAFDKISMMSMYIQNHVRCQRFPHLLEGYDRLTSEQLGKALLENERRLQGCLPWRQADNSVAQKFLKTVEIGSRSVWGSNAERSQCRHKAFAYQTRFGQPALFVTLTPNSDNSLVLAHYTGVLSVDSLFDLLEARLPTKAELREASRENDCASARLFMRHVDAFIRHALGIDPRTRKKLSYRGLLGDVKAYFGMVESQGRGTLHIHLLIWLNHCPPNSTAVMKILGSPQGNVFRERVASYADSIVQNDLPISLDNYNCSSCGASHERLIGLQIPEQARKDPTGRSTKNRSRYRPAEPALVACGRCGAQFSSQHLIRNALLKARPECWPIWRQPLSPNEIEQQAVAESVCRSTKKKAVDIICDRESVHASYCCDLSIREREKLTADLLHQANHRQMPLCKADDDPFRNDTLARLLEISPPSTSDARMAQQAHYMVASLAVLQNQHLWCHTTSCFKNSRVTKSDTYCTSLSSLSRTGTSFQSSGVELKRTLGHEFINGFNYELMATFKCNHDIQVLLGGIDTTERIHYCCKYIAKPQKQLESQVAVAVAALKRREARENAEHTTTATGVDRLTMSRRRVLG
ncbi:hypothetical protein AM588_10001138 [Phytophthora nicotianae]|uniref:Helitron helicase-like domain-containing protein n=1 Tax=Phytophthora nicotianae TaxID=4792 RepID=A0A0W8CQI3_PHYNI|nr:hypothetical protein AM588_10001138 [Phytophthora nicotianae]